MNLITSLLAGCIAHDDVDRVALEELIAISRPLAEASSYTTHVRAEHEIAPASDESTGCLEFEARYERGKPVRVASKEFVAFRGARKIALRGASGEEPWEVTARRGPRPGDDVLAPICVIEAFALPHRLLSNLEDRLVSLRRREVQEDGALFVYEGEVGGGAGTRLSVWVSQGGFIEEIVVGQASALRPPDLDDVSWSYRVEGLDSTVVEVPSEVKELLKDDESHRGLGPRTRGW